MKSNSKVVRLAEAGFTLVELMIVVAIIGILAAIAIPNFQKYQAKARAKEAAIQLSGVYTAEISFRGEYGSFGGCLLQAGFRPEGDPANTNGQVRYYTVGYTGAVATAKTCGNDGNTACNTNFNDSAAPQGVLCNKVADQPFNTAMGAADIQFTATRTTAPAATFPVAGLNGSVLASTVDKDTFLVQAIGNVSNQNIIDTWTINQNKALVNTISGI